VSVSEHMNAAREEWDRRPAHAQTRQPPVRLGGRAGRTSPRAARAVRAQNSFREFLGDRRQLLVGTGDLEHVSARGHRAQSPGRLVKALPGLL